MDILELAAQDGDKIIDIRHNSFPIKALEKSGALFCAPSFLTLVECVFTILSCSSLMPEKRLLDPTLDLNFKRVFANSPDLLTPLINAVRWRLPPITVESIRNPEIVPNDLGKKLIVLDVLARDETGRLFNIELQTRPHNALFGFRSDGSEPGIGGSNRATTVKTRTITDTDAIPPG